MSFMRKLQRHILGTFVLKAAYMRHFLVSIMLTAFLSTAVSQNSVSHQKWTELLQKYVDPYGKVDYKGFKADEARLDEYLDLLSNNAPTNYWKVEDQKAYWINAYNAFTVKLILKNYPLKSIMEIKEGEKNAWNIPFIKIGEKLYTLDYIEKTMLLGQFNDSRIHFAVNCSAVSCPILRDKAYVPENLDIQLRLSARRFINDKRFNILSENHLQISQIFNWYKDDFLKEAPSIQAYIDEHTPHVDVSSKASLNFLDYNWSLNEKKK